MKLHPKPLDSALAFFAGFGKRQKPDVSILIKDGRKVITNPEEYQKWEKEYDELRWGRRDAETSSE